MARRSTPAARCSAAALAERAGRRFEPSQVLDRAGALLLRSTPTAAMRATLRHADALVAARRGQLLEARVAFEDALDLLTQAGVRYESDLVRLDHAEALHASGASEAAEEAARARDAFEALGAAYDAALARRLEEAWVTPLPPGRIRPCRAHGPFVGSGSGRRGIVDDRQHFQARWSTPKKR